LGIASLLATAVHPFTEKISSSPSKQKIWSYASGSIFITVLLISFMQMGKTSRDEDMLHDVRLIGKVVPANSIVSSTYTMVTDWAFHGSHPIYGE
jgi:hypothetical protein